MRERALHTVYTKREAMIAVRDGVRLYTAIYVPADEEPHPVLLIRTPYALRPYGKGFASSLRGAEAVFVHHRYIIVYQNVRGTFRSEGEFVNVRPLETDPSAGGCDEATDTFDTVEWILAHCRTTGSVGVKGISYPGFYATVAALSGHPAIRAVSPQAPVTDWFKGDDAHINGAFQYSMYGFASSFFRSRKGPGIRYPKPLVSVEGDVYDWFLGQDGLGGALDRFGGRLDFINTLRAHPRYDAFWEAADPTRHFSGVLPAFLVVGGWYDGEDCFGTFETWRKLRERAPLTPAHLCAGPWYHGGWKKTSFDHLAGAWFGSGSAQYFMERIEYPFFAYYLEGMGDRPAPVSILPSAETMPSVMQGRDTAPLWERFSAWPAEGAHLCQLHLSEGGGLSFDAPDAFTPLRYVSDPEKPVPFCADTLWWSRDAFAADQRFAARRTDVLTWKGPVLSAPLRVEGPLSVALEVSIDTTDADLVVKLIDIRPDGYQLPVRLGVLPVRFRESLSAPRPAVPGERMRISFSLNDIAHHFLPGHRVAVQLQSSCFPLIAMNPQQYLADPYGAGAADARKAEVTVWGGAVSLRVRE